MKRLKGIELRQIIIGQNEVEIGGEMGNIVGAVIDPLPVHVKTGMLQGTDYEFGICFTILQQEDFQWLL